MNKDDSFENILNFDALQEAENITGKAYTDKETQELGFMMHLLSSQAKKDFLIKKHDTHFNTKMKTFIALAQEEGFEEVGRFPFIYYDFENKETQECFYLFCQKEYGIILALESFNNGETVNKAQFNFCVKMNNKEDMVKFHSFSCSNGPIYIPEWYDSIWDFFYKIYLKLPLKIRFKINMAPSKFKPRWPHYRYGDKDVREGFRFTLRKIIQDNLLCNPWPKNHGYMPWWINFTEAKKAGEIMRETKKTNVYDEIVKEKVQKLPQEIRDIIRM